MLYFDSQATGAVIGALLHSYCLGVCVSLTSCW